MVALSTFDFSVWIAVAFAFGVAVNTLVDALIAFTIAKHRIKRANKMTQEIVARNSVNKEVSHAEMQAMLVESE